MNNVNSLTSAQLYFLLSSGSCLTIKIFSLISSMTLLPRVRTSLTSQLAQRRLLYWRRCSQQTQVTCWLVVIGTSLQKNLTDSQLVAVIKASTQKDLGVPTQSPEVEAALQSVLIKCWALESEQDSAIDPSMEGQDKGLEDPSLSSQSVEPSPSQRSSRQEFEQ